LGLYFFRQKDCGAKAANKMLVKLISGVFVAGDVLPTKQLNCPYKFVAKFVIQNLIIKI
jgi:hypothetical protein